MRRLRLAFGGSVATWRDSLLRTRYRLPRRNRHIRRFRAQPNLARQLFIEIGRWSAPHFDCSPKQLLSGASFRSLPGLNEASCDRRVFIREDPPLGTAPHIPIRGHLAYRLL